MRTMTFMEYSHSQPFPVPYCTTVTPYVDVHMPSPLRMYWINTMVLLKALKGYDAFAVLLACSSGFDHMSLKTASVSF